MKKIRMIAGLLLALSLVSAMSVSAYTITIPGGVGGMPVYGNEYVGPIGAKLDGNTIDGGITCVDYYSTTYVPNLTGFAVTLETLSPVNLTNARFQSSDMLLKYEEAAWLNTQIHVASNASQIGEIQFAMWRLFAPVVSSGADTAGENAWLNQAAIALTNPSLFDFSSVVIYTPTDPTKNQEFISGGAAPVPEPGTIMLLGFGMFGLVVFGKRRMRKDP